MLLEYMDKYFFENAKSPTEIYYRSTKQRKAKQRTINKIFPHITSTIFSYFLPNFVAQGPLKLWILLANHTFVLMLELSSFSYYSVHLIDFAFNIKKHSMYFSITKVFELFRLDFSVKGSTVVYSKDDVVMTCDIIDII